jgi:ABC-type transporter Mla subunit MlaD
LAFAGIPRHGSEVKAYFQNAQGLRAGAPVRLAGVDIGSVKSIRVRPELREHPAEVIMTLRTSYELRIPNDSVVALAQAGVLGETFPDIDIRNASGPPLQDGGELRTRQTEDANKKFFEQVGNILQRRPCDGQQSDQDMKSEPSSKSSKVAPK